MINNTKHSQFREFFATAAVTALVVAMLCLSVEIELLFRCENKVNAEELKMANLSKFCTIEELEKRLKKEPTNYIINIKLAQIYEALKEYNKANELYRAALKLSGRSNFALYSYAMFCAKHNLFTLSATLGEELSGPERKIIEYKARIYEQLGDSLNKDNQHDAAVRAFQIAYKYSKTMKNHDFRERIKEKYSNSYIKLADKRVENDEFEEAIFDLKNSLKIKENPLAKYKLALIYQDVNKKRESEKLLNEVFNKNPYLINPYIYNSLLDKLIKEAKANDNINAASFYTLRQNRLKKTLSQIYLYKNDISIDMIHFTAIKKKFSKEKKYFIDFNIKNNTKLRIDKLYLKADLFINSRQYTLEKKAITHKNSLDYYDTLEHAKLELPNEINLENIPKNSDIIVKFYAKKMSKAPWTLIKIDRLDI